MQPTDHPAPLNVAIVGAGIAGLTAAISLRRQGHHVQIFESSKNPTDIGSISIQINAFRVLKHLGASIESLGGVEFGGLIGFDSESTNGDTQRWLVPEAKEDPGVFCNRKDLAKELRRLALANDGEGLPANLRIGKKVVACDPDEGNLTLDDGEVLHADVILGCDGIGSIIRTSILGYDQKAPSSGWSCFRTLFDAAKMDGIPELAWITEGISGGRFVFAKEEPFRALFVNLCESGKLVNLVAIYTDTEQDNPEWSQAATQREVVERFEDFHPDFRRILDLPSSDSFLRWKLLALPELPTWTRGRTAILGDAAHATFPFLGQGAAMAVEEGGALGCLLPRGTDVKDIPSRLKAYETLCKPRGDFVSAESIAEALEPAKRGRYFRSKELQAYILEYDPITASQEVLSELLSHGI
ncbi:FAD/NAD(P)-binding domain-containing protein [Mycena albidolilacea]|uniref:FAD/NAD(P)-binding domain-containing protein n=1 Tax=Mycena albidolilacea TaxID=1033008 RepID=A0AAD7F1N1_9AGAR|nr:FAD/NAD(P)-binding domain-containing protein [Mycena albidolilacea]